ncbi:MAG TPA: MJ1255/VC2487 family glycosyltransferase [Kofleriaceae bacterium]|nr:MJ1255/VC2487 family glycosyltransferase [Kofleriaceae bacterium]
MRILYGVTGEGLGHAMRSRVMADHLRSRGHEVKLVASRRACSYLRRYFDDVEEIPGFTLTYVKGGVGRTRTLYRNARVARANVRESIDLYRRPIVEFQPDVCVSDFDSFAHMFGKLLGRPVISIDHQHVLDRCEHPALGRGRVPLTRALVRAKVPGCAHYIVTSFYQPPLRPRAQGTTTLVGPILRPEVLALTPSTADHVLVYQTATRDLVAPLFALPDYRFIVYGCHADRTLANVTFRTFDEPQFLADLASARAVICNGGYTLLSEALYLGKPVLSVPLRRHGEQLLNALYLETLGLGRRADHPDANTFRDFLSRLPAPTTTPISAGNSHAFTTIDQLLEELP